jgi:hypothetical protein
MYTLTPAQNYLTMLLPYGQRPIGGGLNPDGSPDALFFVESQTLDLIERDGPEWKYEDARFILEAVSEPDAIFEGLKRAGHADCFCYSVQLTRDPDEPDSTVPPAFGKVFLAFVRRVIGGYLVFDWAWRKEDEDVPGRPQGWEKDFTRPTWSKP